jgi:hypothetical protein
LYQIYYGLYSIYSIGRNFQVFFHFSGLDIYYVLQVQVTVFVYAYHMIYTKMHH